VVHRVECLDVGQGTCNLIQLPGNRFIVIDVGPRGGGWQVLIDRLRLDPDLPQESLPVIEVLILSHSHEDHIGALSSLLESGARIERILFTDDRPIRDDHPALRVIQDAARRGKLSMDCVWSTIETDADGPRTVFQSADPDDEPNGRVALTLLHPDGIYAKKARERGQPNLAFAILHMRVGDHRFLFPGDAPLDAFEVVSDNFGRSVELELMAVPHHGGKTWNGKLSPGRRTRLQKLFQERFRVKSAVISIGSANSNKHPFESVIKALLEAGSHVLCTELTCRCWVNDLDEARELTLAHDPPHYHGLSRKTRPVGKATNVGCASTVVVKFENRVPVIERRSELRGVVENLKRSGSPMCTVN